jgi:DNA-binding CsgD family transcriptional regulator
MTESISFSNFITDSFGSFLPADSADVRWTTANSLFKGLGGTAVNIGAINVDAQIPTWLLSSMDPKWLKQYIEEKYYEIDPLIPHLKKSNKPYKLNTEKSVRSQPLNSKLLNAGYRFLYGMPFSGEQISERKIVTFCSDISVEQFKSSKQLERIRMLAAIIITQVHPPDSKCNIGSVLFYTNPLSQREKEALMWLASGNQNARIADKMKISEVMVRKHLNSVKKKLGAMTREQALGIAIHQNLVHI